MNKERRITGAPRERKPDTHTQAVREAHEDGLADYAHLGPDGEPMLHTSRQRRAAEKRRERGEKLR